MKIVIFIGSIRQPSMTRKLAINAGSALKQVGLTIEWVDLREHPLPIADPDYHHKAAETPNKAVRDLVYQVASSDGIVLASPLYHGSYSGVLKNAIDCLPFDAFRDKPVGLLSHGSGAKRCSQPAEHLVSVVRTVYGHALQCQVASSKSDFTIDPDNGDPILVDEDVKLRCDRMASEMLDYLAMRRAVR
jgi:azobenzene reductase